MAESGHAILRRPASRSATSSGSSRGREACGRRVCAVLHADEPQATSSDSDHALCALQPDASPCNDGNPCTLTDTCSSGVCHGGNPKVCTALDQCHVAGVCSTADGTCSNPNKVTFIGLQGSGTPCALCPRPQLSPQILEPEPWP